MSPQAPPAIVCSLALVAALLTGCGNSRTPVPSLGSPVSAGSVRSLSYPGYGLQISAPANWLNRDGPAPLVTTFRLADAVAALWSYPRQTPPPSGTSALADARRRLIAAAKQKDPSLQLIRAGVTMVGGYPAIELDAFERLKGSPRRVRSTHVFTGSSEVVLDEYAPKEIFHSVDHAVFSPLKRSLRLFSAASG